MAVRQHTQDVRVCPSAHTGRLWLSISTHISTLVLGLSTLALPVDCLGDFGPCGLFVQYTQDVRGCPLAHLGRPCLSVSIHRTSVCARVCPCVSVSTDRTSVAVHQYTYKHVGPWTQHADPSRGLFRTFVAVRVCLYVSVSTHRTSVAVHQYTYQHVGPWTQHAGPSRGLFGTSVAVRVCPCVSVSTHKTFVTVHQYKYQHAVHTGCPWVSVNTHMTSVCVHQHTQDIRGCLCVSINTHRSFVAVHQYTYQPAGPWTQHAGPSRGLFGTSMCVRQHRQDIRGFLCVSVSTHRMSVAVHQYTYQEVGPWTQHADASRGLFGTLVLGLSTLTLPMDCSGDFGPRGLSVQYTQDVHGTHISTLVLGLSTLTLPVDCSGDLAHVGCLFSTHRTSVGPSCLSISINISTLVLGLSMLALPVDCLGDFGPRGLSVQYTQDVCGCLPAQTGRLWLSVAVRQDTQDVHVCPCVSASTHRTSVAVHQYTYQPAVHTGRPWASVSTHRTSVCVRQHTQVIRGCPCVSFSTHRTSVAVHRYTYQHVGPWTQHTDPSHGLFGRFWPTWAVCSVHTGRPWVSASTDMTYVAVLVCPCVSVSTHRTSVAVHQYTYQHYTHDVRGCPLAHTGHPWLSLCVCVCPFVYVSTHRTSVSYTQDVCGCLPAQTGRLWLSVAVRQHTQDVNVCLCVSVSTHRTCVAVHQYAYQHVGPWTQHADPSRGLFGASVAVCVCPCVSVSTHRTSVAVHQYTYQHADPSSGLFGTHRTSVAVRVCPTLTLPVDSSGDFGPRGLSVQYTEDVSGCPLAHTGRPWLSVCVRVCPSAHTGRPWLSNSTHISTLVLGLSTLALPMDCSGDCGPRGLSVQYTQDVRGCPSAHTGRPCVSVSTHRTSVAVLVCPCVFMCVRQHTQDVRSCPSVHISARCTHRTTVGVRQHKQDVGGFLWLSVSTHRTSVANQVCPCLSIRTNISTLVLGLSTLALPVDYLGDFSPRGMSVQYTQDVRGCPPAQTGRSLLSVAVCQHTQEFRVCPTLDIPVDCSGDFGPRGLSVQYTQDVCGCPSAHTGRPCLSVSIHRTSVAVCVCLCVSVSTHRTSVAIHLYTYQHYTQDVRGCPSAHTGRSCFSVSTHTASVAVFVCPCVSVSTHRTSVAVHQYTYQHVGPWTQHADPSRGLFGIHRTAVAVHQYTYQHISPLTQHADPSSGQFGTHRTSVAVHQYTYQPAGPWTQHAGPWTQHAGPSCVQFR
ncbi:hypothetical protein YC2023_066344 [Brassica napus]